MGIRDLSASYRFLRQLESYINTERTKFSVDQWGLIKLIRGLNDIGIYSVNVSRYLTVIFKSSIKYQTVPLQSILDQISDFNKITPAVREKILAIALTSAEVVVLIQELFVIAAKESLALGEIVNITDYNLKSEGSTAPAPLPVLTGELTHYSQARLFYAGLAPGPGNFAILDGYSYSSIDTLTAGKLVSDSFDVPCVTGTTYSSLLGSPVAGTWNYSCTASSNFTLNYAAQKLLEESAPSSGVVKTISGLDHYLVYRSVGDSTAILVEFTGDARSKFVSIDIPPLIVGKLATDVITTPSVKPLTYRWLADNVLEIRIPVDFSSKVVHEMANLLPVTPVLNQTSAQTQIGGNYQANGGRRLSMVGVNGGAIVIAANSQTRPDYTLERITKATPGMNFTGTTSGPYFADFLFKAQVPLYTNTAVTTIKASLDFGFLSTVHPELTPAGVIRSKSKCPLRLRFSGSVTMVSAVPVKPMLSDYTSLVA